MKKFLTYIKQETVLTVSFILAIAACIITKPSFNQMAGYVNFRVLGILLALMLVVCGLQEIGLFHYIGNRLLRKAGNTRRLISVLVFLCFFLSMAFTNDVALITFVPFAIFVLEKAGHPELLIFTVVLQTIAANLGSMLTPVGNPQNLYIYQYYGFTTGEFVLNMLPYAVTAFLLLILLVFFKKNETVKLEDSDFEAVSPDWHKACLYILLFSVCLFGVTGVFYWLPVLLFVCLGIVLIDRKIFLKADYGLLLTFMFFFLFIGCVGSVPSVRETLSQIITGHEVLVGVMTSQIVSNVPAALLLSEFTENGKDLLIGINLGGLGTLIASMASLISYKCYTRVYKKNKGKYLLWFTLASIIFLAVLLVIYYILQFL